MNVNERVKKIRAILNLSQVAFGAPLNLSQRAVAHIESGNNGLTDRNFESICRVYNVNPRWLESGEGVMFAEKKTKNYLELLAEEKNLSPNDIAIIQSILDLPPEIRQAAAEWLFNLARKMKIQNSETEQEKRRRELEKQIRDAQEELDKLNSEVSPEIKKNTLEKVG